ncbi:D-3-phosphoglycerate dehydrogenase [Clostridium pascui]|uniref:C-terminal binding protein n=1 Tax=Clostridium pascui TaxID=46609 RepID=UPI00195E9D6C|nr:C-terminal binding protein [Clostridium pascui]MBM7872134.1 D-3-phosphoglycerate dehydrogenase [Clostridium pascui]
MLKTIWIIDGDWKEYEIEEKIIKENLPGHEIKYSGRDFHNDLEAFGKYAEAIIAQIDIKISSDVIDKLENCKVISVYGIGYDNIDVKYAKSKGIVVANVPGYCIEEVSDHVISFIFEFYKSLSSYKDKIKQGLWGVDAMDYIPKRIKDSVLFLVGFGKIAKLEAKKAKALGMDVLVYDPYVNDTEFKDYGVRKVTLEEGLELSDYVSIAVPLNENTRGMIGIKELKLMKKSAVLINASRGEIIIENDLIEAVKNRVIRGAGLDVVCNEPPNPESEILNVDNIIVTPHISYSSKESIIELRETVALNVIEALNNMKVKNSV